MGKAIPLMYFVEDPWADEPPPSHRLKSRGAEIAQMAYFLSEARGFEPGYELEDWLAAEQEYDARRSDEAHRLYVVGG